MISELEKRQARESFLKQKGCTVWFTGLTAAGKSTLAYALEEQLLAANKLTYVLDGDELRKGLCKNLGFSVEDRKENVRRAGEVARLLSDMGCITLCALVSPQTMVRQEIRQIHTTANIPFIEIYVATPLATCEQWDKKNIYTQARKGVLKSVVGLDIPYETPLKPDMILRPDESSLTENVQKVWDLIRVQI